MSKRIALSLLLVVAYASSAHAQAPSPFSSRAFLTFDEQKNKEDRKKDKDNGNDKEKDKDNGNDKEKDKEKEKEEDKGPKWLSVHAQATSVFQGNWKFHSPYLGPNSLLPNLNYQGTVTGTLFLDMQVCPGGDIVVNPELAAGRGLSRTLGLAGFPNGEATRVGNPEPTPYFARFLYRHTIGLGGEQEKVEDGPNQIAGTRDIDRLTFRIGKMSASDLFDDNRYSHDPRNQFLNWSLMYNGAWDYPANARGYTYGATLELNQKEWALRYGAFAEPTVANGQDLDPHFLQANGHALEFEYRYKCDDHPGKLRLMGYLNNAHMGNYREALELMPVNPDITLTRTYRVKYGFGLNLEQELTETLGFFSRLGWNDGHTETWAFTEIDATLALGLALQGKSWCRPKDVLGFAGVVNGLSNGHRDYLAAGGIGFIIGDGKLHYGAEEILELYYNLELAKGINVSFDLQGVNNPAYNRDRGPVGLAAVRVHLEY